MRALIDGDIPCYSCAAAALETEYLVYPAGDMERGHIASFKYKRDAYIWIDTNGEREDFEIEKNEILGPVSHAIQNARTLIDKIMKQTGADSMIIYISGNTNFREDIATIKPYKGNRADLKKPEYYPKIKEYLLKHYPCVVTVGIEADDAMTIEQCADETNSTIICSIDKDLDMVPGWHYNWSLDRVYKVDTFGSLEYDSKKNKLRGTGLKWFYAQMLMGDTIDNIPGVPGVGDKTAFNTLNHCTTQQELSCAVGYEYALKYDDPEAAMLENGRLLWMLRHPFDEWEIEYEEL